MNDAQRALWQEAVSFHGHSCPGLAIGVRVAMDYQERINISGRSEDEEIVAIVETDACGVDGIQVLLGCTAGKGNLWVFPRGKHAFTIFQRTTARGVRFAWKNMASQTLSREEKIHLFLTAPAETLYSLTAARCPMPPKADIYPFHSCSLCGEITAEPHVRMKAGQVLCRECVGESLVFWR
jgi:formylmethanofuran dehydrogenase subunit E